MSILRFITGEQPAAGSEACSHAAGDEEEEDEGEGEKIAAVRSTPAETSGRPGEGHADGAGWAGRGSSTEAPAPPSQGVQQPLHYRACESSALAACMRACMHDCCTGMLAKSHSLRLTSAHP